MRKSIYKFTTAFLCVLIILTSLNLNVISFGASTGKTTWSIDSNGKLTVSGTGPTEYTSVYSGRILTNYPLWKDRVLEIKSAEIKSGITEIAYAAFSECKNLESISIPDTVTKISNIDTFDGCDNLKEITVDPNNQYFSAEQNVLFDKDKTTLVYYPHGLEAEEYTVPNGVKVIKGWAFDGSDIKNGETIPTIAAKKIVLPDGVETIEPDAFFGFTNLEEINLPESLKTIGYSAFCYCRKLKNITIPGKVSKIESDSFLGCENLEKITISEGVTEIGSSAFSKCNMEKIELPNSVVKIGNGAFSSCSNLKSIHIPSKTTEIGTGIVNNGSFEYICSDAKGCSAETYADENGFEFFVCDNGELVEKTLLINDGVKSISLRGKSPESIKLSLKADGKAVENSECIFESSNDKIITVDSSGTVTAVHCGRAKITVSKERCISANIDVTVDHLYTSEVKKPSCTETGYTTYTCSDCGYSFKGDETPTASHKFVFQETVSPTCTERGYDIYACSGCGLTRQSNYTPANGHYYENGVCVDCGKVQAWEYEIINDKVVIKGVEGTETEIRVPSTIEGKTVETIKASALSNNNIIKYVYIPDSVKYIEENAFRNCSSLNEVYLGSNIVSIGSGAFADCKALSIVCTDAENLVMASNCFANSNARLTFVSREGTAVSNLFAETGKHCITYSYPHMREDKKAVAYHGNVVAYQDLDSHYWNETAQRYSDITYLYFESIEIQGVPTSEVVNKISENHYVKNAVNLTLKEVYIKINIDGEDITFENLSKKLKEGYSDLLITFDDTDGGELTILQRIGRGITQVLKTLTKLLNSIIKAFKKK